MSFLKAEWNYLSLANYVVDQDILSKYLPAGTELDLWNGKCYLSLVGFMFENTKVLGVKIPFHVNFEEMNLRFYVKRLEGSTWKRGVVFIKEIVPKYAITAVANGLYKENYETQRMRHHWELNSTEKCVSYGLKKAGKWHEFNVVAQAEKESIEKDSDIEFITEHYWGYAHLDDKASNEYEVTHPSWDHYPVKSFNIDFDFEMVYGTEFSFLNTEEPESVMLAKGSEITVESKRKIYV